MIDHRRACELTAVAFDFDLDDADRRDLETHLHACAACRAEALAIRSDAAALAALPLLEPPSWVRQAIGRRDGPRRAVLLAAAALLVTATVGVALAVGAVLRHEAPTVLPPDSPRPTLGSASPRPSVPASPVASAPAGSMPIAKATSFPANGESARMAPGPAGGVWVLVDQPAGGVGDESRSVLGLFDDAGRARAGWPVAFVGWRCGDEMAPHGLPVATDGSIRLVCAEDTGVEGPQRHVALAFDATGRALPGWPVVLPDGELQLPPVVVDDELRLLGQEIASTEGSVSLTQAAAWWLIAVSASGELRIGQRYEVADAAGSFDVRIAANGVAYRVAFSGGPGTESTAITAIDLGGRQPGWPVTVEGIASQPVAGPDGRLVITRRLGRGADARAQTMAIDPAGGDATATSDGLPIDPLDDRTGAGAEVLTPIVAADGAIYVIGSDATGQRVFTVDPPVAGRGVVPASLAMPLQPMGTCAPEDTGCGVWRALPVVGPDGTLYVPESAVGEGGGLSSSSGGSLVAIAPDGTSPTGWPVFLPDSMAGFWSLLARTDGTIDALAVVPTDAGGQWTLVTLGADGRTRSSTPLTLP